MSCHNLPPRIAFPTLPPLPRVPATVDADRWLHAYDGHTFVRKVAANGQVLVDEVPYYMKLALLRQHVAQRVEADAGTFGVEADGREVQRVAIKGIGVGRLPFPLFVEPLCAQARTFRSAAYRRMAQHA